MPLALARATFPPLVIAALQRLGQPRHGVDGGAQGGVLRGIGGAGIVRNRRPGAGILDIPAKRLEAEAAVGPPEQVDAAVVLGVLDAVEDEPRFVDAHGHPSVSAAPGRPPIGERLPPGARWPSSDRAGSRIGSAAGSTSRRRARASASSASRSGPSPISQAAATARAASRVGASSTPSTASCRSASAWPARSDIERAFDLLLARVDQGDEALRREPMAPHGFAEQFDDRLCARLARARRLGHRLAPPFEPDARQHRLARDGAGARKLMIEGQQAPADRERCGLGREQRAEEAVAVGRAHLVEHIAVRCCRRAVGARSSGDKVRCATVERRASASLQ